mmetsp:Transcript_41574/g.69297  ORF Transcript_41574/g.69297 Transcript_41574/m.69297 type:complete len:172 (+) Transcript_41574:587-1102(+)
MRGVGNHQRNSEETGKPGDAAAVTLKYRKEDRGETGRPSTGKACFERRDWSGVMMKREEGAGVGHGRRKALTANLYLEDAYICCNDLMPYDENALHENRLFNRNGAARAGDQVAAATYTALSELSPDFPHCPASKKAIGHTALTSATNIELFTPMWIVLRAVIQIRGILRF